MSEVWLCLWELYSPCDGDMSTEAWLTAIRNLVAVPVPCSSMTKAGQSPPPPSPPERPRFK